MSGRAAFSLAGRRMGRRLAPLSLVLAAAGLVTSCSEGGAGPAPPAAASVPARAELPPSPVQERLTACMNDAGWSARRSWLGGVDYAEIPGDEQPAFDDDFARCSTSSRWSEAVDLDPDQRRELYAQEVAAHACYERIGVTSSPPPDLHRYLETYATKKQYLSFLPGFDRLPEKEMMTAIEACPPPSWFLDLPSLN